MNSHIVGEMHTKQMYLLLSCSGWGGVVVKALRY